MRGPPLRRESIGVVFQQFNLIPSLTVGENLAFQARLAGRYDPAWQEELTARLGLDELWPRAIPSSCPADSSSASPSAARSPCARGFCSPTSPPAISTKRPATTVMALALELVAATGCAFLMATHSARLAARLERRVRLEAGLLAAP